MRFTGLGVLFVMILIMDMPLTGSAASHPSTSNPVITSPDIQYATTATRASTSHAHPHPEQRNALLPFRDALVFSIIGTGLVVCMRKYRVL